MGRSYPGPSPSQLIHYPSLHLESRGVQPQSTCYRHLQTSSPVQTQMTPNPTETQHAHETHKGAQARPSPAKQSWHEDDPKYAHDLLHRQVQEIPKQPHESV